MEPKPKFDVTLFDRPASNTKFVKPEQRVHRGDVQRYRAHRAPRWKQQVSAVESDEESEDTPLAPQKPSPGPDAQADPRLARLAAARALQARGGPRRRVREAIVLEEEPRKPAAPTPPANQVIPPADGPDEFARRRARARALRAQEPEEEVLPEEQAANEDESEYEEVTDSDESEEVQERALAKAVFVRRDERLTVLERRIQEEKLRKEAERQKALREKRRDAAHRLVVVAAGQEEMREQEFGDESDGDLPDDDDNKDEAAEYEAWKLRELQRIRRYKEERERDEAEKREVERRRLLSDDARKLEDIEYQRKLEEMGLSRDKVKWNYMQKYFHKGAYFMGTQEKGMEKEKVYQRDFGAAVGMDKADKELLPTAMHKRGADFGKKGQSKWTHLTAEDTSYVKDAQGNSVENPFTSITFAAKKSGVSANMAHQGAENHMMFRNAEPGRMGQATIGSATYGSRKAGQADTLDRPAKRPRR
eukprot:TRINITY_DN39194_c0_g1_i1.p1 TRINITY_DN39194_c0_g1~~TRINITY_DN39194_c0_g1_i1.p1  ORF type:complete len:477 (+),score=168.74 TRINITY_DN39194_c0_g1_i1:54-1484(+)